ncbi:aminotransferase class V-fold PLP-dependent enzyme [Allosphingosinicella vermicomposti]|uniref:aminotransferase class V-fold PLP-dependent enzyme n=1 Tax=Allosphingosinicella vermicomposti TaxID=614671 RepID=UPI000D0F0BF3|nr:aminotransferase class V-fold PLP-dependent enzyme [Allosphingosinicella vermicomposti]
MSWKRLFSRALDAAPGRIHMAAHSHHLWPDASFQGQVEAWEDAAALADHKWGKVMGSVWTEAQGHVARTLGLPDPQSIVFAGNTHDFIIRLVLALERKPVRILATDGEFHSFRRQIARWIEDGTVTLDTVAVEPFEDFPARMIEQAKAGAYDLIFLSQVFFGSGHVLTNLEPFAALARPEGPWVVVDGYHGFMAVETDLAPAADRIFYLAGGYKYAMAGEGCAFLHCPPGFGERPPLTGWYAEFADLAAAPGGGIGYAKDAMRFMGATFDPSALYRVNAVQRMLRDEGITIAKANAYVRALQHRLVDGLPGTKLSAAALINPLNDRPHARFLAFRTPGAARLSAALEARNIVTDVRGDVLRIGFALYQDQGDVDALIAALSHTSC